MQLEAEASCPFANSALCTVLAEHPCAVASHVSQAVTSALVDGDRSALRALHSRMSDDLNTVVDKASRKHFFSGMLYVG